LTVTIESRRTIAASTGHHHPTLSDVLEREHNLSKADNIRSEIEIVKVITPGTGNGANKRSREVVETPEILDVTPVSISSRPSNSRTLSSAKKSNQRVAALNRTLTKSTGKISDWLQPKNKQRKRNEDDEEEEDEEEAIEKTVNSSSTDFFDEHASRIRQMNPQNEVSHKEKTTNFTVDYSEPMDGNATQFNASLIAEKLAKAISFVPLVRSIAPPSTSDVQSGDNSTYPNVKKFRKAPQGWHMYNSRHGIPGSPSISQSMRVFPMLQEATPPRH